MAYSSVHFRLKRFQVWDEASRVRLPSFPIETQIQIMKMRMTPNHRKILASLAVLTCFSVGSYAAEGDYRSPGNPPASTARYNITGTPTKVNKATSLIGMEVRNHQDEKLGTIKDFVVDLNSGRVSYVVFDSGGLLKTKLFAVPLNAFRASSDQNHLVLNADKKKMETAKGIDQDMWPNVSNPVWGAETFWEQPPGTERFPAPTQRIPQDRPQEQTPRNPQEKP